LKGKAQQTNHTSNKQTNNLHTTRDRKRKMTYVTYGLKVAATLSIEMLAPGFGMVVAALSMMYDEVKALNMDDKILEIVVMGLDALMNNDGKVTSGGMKHFCKNFPDMNITLMIVKTENRPLYQKITRVWNIVAQAVQQAEKQNNALDLDLDMHQGCHRRNEPSRAVQRNAIEWGYRSDWVGR
jgi:hypothetical protein